MNSEHMEFRTGRGGRDPAKMGPMNIALRALQLA